MKILLQAWGAGLLLLRARRTPHQPGSLVMTPACTALALREQPSSSLFYLFGWSAHLYLCARRASAGASVAVFVFAFALLALSVRRLARRSPMVGAYSKVSPLRSQAISALYVFLWLLGASWPFLSSELAAGG